MSFSSELKIALAEIPIKKKCCQYTYNEIIKTDKKSQDDKSELFSSVYERCRCTSCSGHFVRALFINYGSMTDPNKSYHLDLTFKNESERDAVSEILSDCGLEPSVSTRNDKYVVYFKGSSKIEDFLVLSGGTNAAMELINSTIVREVRSAANRQVNCDTANIEKQLEASKKYIQAIEYLKVNGIFDNLTEELKKTAETKLNEPQLSLKELAKSMNVSKSCITHRLERLYSIYIENQQGD